MPGGFVPYCNWNASLSLLSPYYEAFGFLLSRYVWTPVDHIIAMPSLCVCFRSCSLAACVCVCVSLSLCYSFAVRTPILRFQVQDFRKATLHNSIVCIKELLLLSMWFFGLCRVLFLRLMVCFHSVAPPTHPALRTFQCLSFWLPCLLSPVGLISLFSYLISQHHSAFYQPCVTPAFQKSFFYVLWRAF